MRKIIGDLRLLGKSDWYIVRNKAGKTVIRRETLIRPSDTVLSGPYETKDQAICEK